MFNLTQEKQTNESGHEQKEQRRLFLFVWGGSSSGVSAVDAHARALVQVHVGVAEQTLGHALHVPRHLPGELGRRHLQVSADLRAGAHLGDVEAVCLSWTQVNRSATEDSGEGRTWGQSRALTFSVRHAVEEDPVLGARSVFDEGHVVAGLDAEHGEQLQLVSGQSLRGQASQVTFGDVQIRRLMGLPLRVTVHLRRKTNYEGNSCQPSIHFQVEGPATCSSSNSSSIISPFQAWWINKTCSSFLCCSSELQPEQVKSCSTWCQFKPSLHNIRPLSWQTQEEFTQIVLWHKPETSTSCRTL